MPYIVDKLGDDATISIICTVGGVVIANRYEVRHALVTSELFKEEVEISIPADANYVLRMFQPLMPIPADTTILKFLMRDYFTGLKLIPNPLNSIIDAGVQILLRDAFGSAESVEKLNKILPFYIFVDPNSPVVEVMKRYDIPCFGIDEIDYVSKKFQDSFALSPEFDALEFKKQYELFIDSFIPGNRGKRGDHGEIYFPDPLRKFSYQKPNLIHYYRFTDPKYDGWMDSSTSNRRLTPDQYNYSIAKYIPKWKEFWTTVNNELEKVSAMMAGDL